MLSLKSIFRDVCFSILFVLVTFAPSIKFLPYYTWFMALLGAWVLTNKKFNVLIGFNSVVNRKFWKYLLFVLGFNSIVVPIAHFSGDFTYIPLQIGIILSLLRSVLLIYCLHRWGDGDIFQLYGKYFFIACIIYVSFTIGFIIDPGFKAFWLETVINGVVDRSQEFAAYEFRYSLDGFAAFSSASIFSFACLFCSYFISDSKKINILRIACLMIMVVGCFFYGRVSLVGMLLGAGLILWTSGSITKTMRIVGIIIAFVFGLLAVLNTVSASNDALVLWQEWAFAFIKQLFVDKEVTDYSATHMVEDMYYMPDLFTLIFGDGRYTNANESYYGHTDVGFMRLILYGGLISLTLVYSIIIKLFKAISKCTRIVVLKRFVLLVTVLFFVLEMKGESYQRALMMLYPIYLIVNYKNNLSFAQNENKS